MATIVQRGRSYHVVYRYQNEEGEKKQKWETYHNAAEAHQRKYDLDFCKKTKVSYPKRIITISDLLDSFVESYGTHKWALKTYETKLGYIENHIRPFIGDYRLERVQPIKIDHYYKDLMKCKLEQCGQSLTDDDRRCAARIVHEVHKILMPAFLCGIRWGYLKYNPAAGASLPTLESPSVNYWSVEEVSKALALCHDIQLRCAIQLAYFCSMRLGEILGLTWDCLAIDKEAVTQHEATVVVNKELQRVSKKALVALSNHQVIHEFENRNHEAKSKLVLKIPKTKASSRTIWLPTSVANSLCELKNMYKRNRWQRPQYNLVFAGAKGFPIDDSRMSERFSNFVSEEGLPKVTFHSLRHTSVSQKLKLSKGNIKAVQGDTGHAKLRMILDVYSHINDEDRRNLAVLMEDDMCKIINKAPSKEGAHDV